MNHRARIPALLLVLALLLGCARGARGMCFSYTCSGTARGALSSRACARIA